MLLKLSGTKYDISNLSDVYEAINVVQTELGITGNYCQRSERDNTRFYRIDEIGMGATLSQA